MCKYCEPSEHDQADWGGPKVEYCPNAILGDEDSTMYICFTEGNDDYEAGWYMFSIGRSACIGHVKICCCPVCGRELS